MKIAVVAHKVPNNIKELININEYLFYACDEAVLELNKQQIPIELAIGDFDSLEDISLLENIKTIKLSREKDDSDTAYALRHAYQQTDDVILIGGIQGSRSDHFIANLLLFEKYQDLIIMDANNKIFKLFPGELEINKDNFQYLSIFPLEDCKITLRGVKYPLDFETIFKFDVIGLSNEIVDSTANLDLSTGELLVILSKE